MNLSVESDYTHIEKSSLIYILGITVTCSILQINLVTYNTLVLTISMAQYVGWGCECDYNLNKPAYSMAFID